MAVSCTVAFEVGLNTKREMEEAIIEIKQATEHEILRKQICNEVSCLLCLLNDTVVNS